MTREQLEQYITETYSVEAEHPWASSPDNTVFRHNGNRKWFALLMQIPRDKLGLPSQESIHVMNLKCDPRVIGSVRALPGVFPAYHMNKSNWITVVLDGSVDQEQLLWLLEQSYDLTNTKKHRTKAAGE